MGSGMSWTPELGRLTPAERAERGKAARAEVPRESHAVFDPPPDRPDPVALLEEQATVAGAGAGADPVGPDDGLPVHLLPRGGAADGQRPGPTPVSGLAVQACGDAHLSNFGIFGSAERRLVFDVNDFDETLPGPWEWDVKRLAASMEVAGRGNGFSGKDAPRDRHGHGRQLPAGDARLRRDDQPGCLVRARGRGPAAGGIHSQLEKRQRKMVARAWPRHGPGTACRK